MMHRAPAALAPALLALALVGCADEPAAGGGEAAPSASAIPAPAEPAAGTGAEPAAGAVEPTWATAEIREVDAAAGTVRLAHGRIENLDMAPMTMRFGVEDPAWLAGLEPGQQIRFKAVQTPEGGFLVTALEPAQ